MNETNFNKNDNFSNLFNNSKNIIFSNYLNLGLICLDLNETKTLKLISVSTTTKNDKESSSTVIFSIISVGFFPSSERTLIF